MQRVYDLSSGALSWAVFYEQVAERSLIVVARAHWQTEASHYAGAAKVLFRDRGHGNDEVVIESKQNGTVTRVLIAGGEVFASVAAEDDERAARTLERLRVEIKPTPLDQQGLRPITFWTYGPNGPESNTRRITVPTWEAVQSNYGQVERDGLDALMGRPFRPTSGGQLILWQGEAGTGKTWALRALVWEWREWADFHYIVDPEQFFGEHANYLTSVLFHEDGSVGMPTWRQGEKMPEPEKAAEARWKVLILEDSGELLSADAKERVGQALSRLLNVVDGLIGQGLRVLVLVTTNEPVKRLHEAIARPGRCAAQIAFEPLGRHEADAWLVRRGSQERVDSAMTLAQLYAALDGRVSGERQPVGFG